MSVDRTPTWQERADKIVSDLWPTVTTDERKVIRLHQILEDGGHWFCCGAGEQFVQAASELVDDDSLTALLPLVETYARERVTERLIQAALYFDGYAESTEIALGGQRYVVEKLHEMAADPSELYPCNCPDRHCGDCGCCPDEWGPR